MEIPSAERFDVFEAVRAFEEAYFSCAGFKAEENSVLAGLRAALPHLVADHAAEIAVWKKSGDEQIQHYDGLVNSLEAEIARLRRRINLYEENTPYQGGFRETEA